MRGLRRRRTPLQRRLDLIPGERFGQNLPLPRRRNVQRRIMLNSLVEQQITIQMSQSRELSPHAAAVHSLRKELLQKLAHVATARGQQESLPFLKKHRELPYVGGIGRY